MDKLKTSTCFSRTQKECGSRRAKQRQAGKQAGKLGGAPKFNRQHIFTFCVCEMCAPSGFGAWAKTTAERCLKACGHNP
jgi:hypothetical protein